MTPWSQAAAALQQTGLDVLAAETPAPVARVESTHRMATQIGYASAPVVLAVNPEFAIGGGERHKKWTVAKYNDSVPVDLVALRDQLNAAEQRYGGEPLWGGSSSILGSPQGVASRIPDEEIERLVVAAATAAWT